MDGITTSVFDLFKIGPGPSSSHTIGPMKAGYDFSRLAAALPEETQARATGLRVRLFGSLSATGRGHGTDRAVLAGLLGRSPESCPPGFLDELARDPDVERFLELPGARVPVRVSGVVFDRVEHAYPFQNTLVIELLDRDATLLEREYYSVGGGFLQWKGWTPPRRGLPTYEYSSMARLQEILDGFGLTLPGLVLENEMAVTGAGEAEIYAGLREVLAVMERAVDNGLEATGVLPGSLGLHRKARAMLERAASRHRSEDRFLVHLAACALAASEENAAGHVIVTAPTCGSAGVLPSVARIIRAHLNLPEKALLDGLLAAAAVGFLVKHNATIAGAEGGCQAEIGVASAMAAAMLAQAEGCNARVVEHAAEIALEHHLGMTCDPVGGYVQIPCIERNAMGAVKAYTAYLISSDEPQAQHKVGLDQAIAAMLATGRDMCAKYKETSLGGLAVSVTSC
jgi:L-serine dehydratase